MPATQKTKVPAAAQTPLEPPPAEPAEPRAANVEGRAEAEWEVEEVPAPAPEAEKQMNWEKNNRKEMLFEQITVKGVDAFLTYKANIKPDKNGKGGKTFNKKDVWENPDDGIMTMLKQASQFEGVPWPKDFQGVVNYVDRVLKHNKHLFTPGMEQAEPAAAGTKQTKDEELTAWQQVRLRTAASLCMHRAPPADWSVQACVRS